MIYPPPPQRIFSGLVWCKTSIFASYLFQSPSRPCYQLPSASASSRVLSSLPSPFLPSIPILSFLFSTSLTLPSFFQFLHFHTSLSLFLVKGLTYCKYETRPSQRSRWLCANIVLRGKDGDLFLHGVLWEKTKYIIITIISLYHASIA